jgi:hypothetical protein
MNNEQMLNDTGTLQHKARAERIRRADRSTLTIIPSRQFEREALRT